MLRDLENSKTRKPKTKR